MNKEKDYVISICADEAKQEEETKVITYDQLEKAAMQYYDPENRIYSAYLKDDDSVGGTTDKTIMDLSSSPQSSLEKTRQIISICRQYANFDDIIGLTNESIENNLSTKIRLSFKKNSSDDLDKDIVERAKYLIEDFNDKIDLPAQLARAIPSAWRDGTYVMCMRKRDGQGENTDYVVDYYPLGVVEISSYEVGGQPYVLFNIQELRNRLQKNYPKNKKRKGLFFDNMDEEVKANYPPEVYKAYKEKEKYAKIPIAYSGVLRVNTQNKQYGLPSAFRALPSALMLENFAKADKSTAKARAKKIVVQYLHKEVLGDSYNRDSYAQQAYAHRTLMEAWKQPTVVVTAPATVRQMEYVEPKAETTNIALINFYRQKEMNTLGISFLANGGAQSISLANISLTQLMKTINKISRQTETVLKKWYREVLAQAGIDPKYAPDVSVIDAELMELGIKKDLADFLFTKLNCSYQTAYELFNINMDDEKMRREQENDSHMEDVFSPRVTAYTNPGSGNKDGNDGRPPSEDKETEDKRDYDKTRNELT